MQGGVTVTLKAPEGALPMGSKLKAHQVGQQYINAVENTLEAQGRTLSDAVAIDVTPVDKDGNEVQPRKSVSVTFSGTGLDLEAGDSVDVYRVSDDASSVTNVGGGGSANSQTFSTNHFTIYVAGGSATNPNGDGSGANTQDNRYVLAYGESVTLRANTSSEYWTAYVGSSYVTLSNPENRSVIVRNTNATSTDQYVIIRHHQRNNREYFYILAKAQVSHTVTFKLKDAGKSSFETEDTQTVTDGGNATAPNEDETKTVGGTTYEFDGWYTDEACTEPAELSNITEDKTFYAKYDVTGYEVVFKLQDAGESSFADVKTETVEEGGDATAPDEDATKVVDGKTYEFDGWYADQACTEEAVLTNITEPKTFYGKYKLAKHTVTYMFKDAGEDSFEADDPANEEVESGSATADTPSHDDTKTVGDKTYEFSGWCTDQDCTEEADLSNITDDITVYAKYSARVKLTYDENSGTDRATVPGTVEALEGNKVTLGEGKREEYAFKSWNTEKDGSGMSYGASVEFTMPEDDVTLYAQWSQDFINVIYHNNYDGAEDEFYTDENVAGNNEHYVVIANMPTRQHYLFNGWALRESGDPAYGPQSYCETGNDDLHLYAQWTPYDPSHLVTTELTAKGMTVPYNGSEYTIEDVEDDDCDRSGRKYGSQGYVKVSTADSGQHYHNIYAYINNIVASGTDAGTYNTPLTAPLYVHGDDGTGFVALGESIPVNNHALVITPIELTISTDSDEKLYDGNPLTAGGKIEVGDEAPQKFTYDGSNVTLVGGEQLKIKTTGAQTQKGKSENGYEINWGESTAKKLNYTVNEGEIGTLEVYTNKVAYDKNAGDDEVSGMPEGSDEEGTTYDIPSDEPSRDYYTFEEWNTAADGSGDPYKPGATYTFPSDEHEVTFYAIWEAEEYKIEYDYAEGASPSTANPIKYTVEDEISIENAPTRTGYDFVGWTGPDAETPKKTVEFGPGAHDDRKYTANWEPIVYDITYLYDGGEAPEKDNPATYTIEDEVSIVNEPSRTGYNFLGWTGSNGDTPQTEVTFKGETGDKSYKANWEPIVYDITYDYDGGEAPEKDNPATYTVEDEVSITNEPTREGYYFTGWTGTGLEDKSKAVDFGPGETGNREYTATWQKCNPAKHDPPVKKVVSGDTPESDATFKFSLTAVSTTAEGLDKMPMPEGADGDTKTVEIKGAGEYEFGIIEFTEIGEYIYKITEVDTNEHGYTYDGAVYTVKYTVTQEGENLVADRVISKDGSASDEVVFNNVYKADEESEEIIIDDETRDDKKADKKETKKHKTKSPETGDETALLLWLTIVGMAMMMMFGFTVVGRREE